MENQPLFISFATQKGGRGKIHFYRLCSVVTVLTIRCNKILIFIAIDRMISLTLKDY